MHIVIKADELVFLAVDCLDSLLRAHHQREHLCVAVCIVRFKVTGADLPGAEQFGSIVVQRTELVHRSFRQFLSGRRPYLLKC